MHVLDSHAYALILPSCAAPALYDMTADENPFAPPAQPGAPEDQGFVQRPGQEDLFRLIKHRDARGLALWLSEWSDILPRQKGKNGTFPIQAALDYGWEPGAIRLLSAGDNPNRMARHAVSGEIAELAPLAKAFAGGHREFLAKALDSSGDASSPELSAQWPLAIAGRIVSSGSAAAAFAEFEELGRRGAALFDPGHCKRGDWIRLGSQIARQEKSEPGSCAAAAQALLRIYLSEKGAEPGAALHGLAQVASCIRIPIQADNWGFIATPVRQALCARRADPELSKTSHSILSAAFGSGNLELFGAILSQLPEEMRMPAACRALCGIYHSDWDEPFGCLDPERKARALKADPKAYLGELNQAKFDSQLRYLNELFPCGCPELQNPKILARFIEYAQLGLALFSMRDHETASEAFDKLADGLGWSGFSAQITRLRDDGARIFRKIAARAFKLRIDAGLAPGPMHASLLACAKRALNDPRGAAELLRLAASDAERACLDADCGAGSAQPRRAGI